MITLHITPRLPNWNISVQYQYRNTPNFILHGPGHWKAPKQVRGP